MSHLSTSFDNGRRPSHWEHETTMLASSMMLVSISEERPTGNVGYKSRLCCSSSSPSGSRVGSGSGLVGWGSSATRQSCKMDLCSLASSSQEDDAVATLQRSMNALSCYSSSRHQQHHQQQQQQHATRGGGGGSDDQGWGFFATDGFGRQR